MRIVVDLNPVPGIRAVRPTRADVLKLNGEEALMYDPNPDDAQRLHVLRAAALLPGAGDHRGPAGREGRKSVKTSAVVAALVTEFKTHGRIVIVGASLAGLRAAEALRDEGFNGNLTIIGDEKHEPYDRPPLSKQVLKGWVRADHTKLPRLRKVDAEWRLGVAATGLDRKTKQVRLANGEQVPFDRLLIATGVRAGRGSTRKRPSWTACSRCARPTTRPGYRRRWPPSRGES